MSTAQQASLLIITILTNKKHYHTIAGLQISYSDIKKHVTGMDATRLGVRN
jgi:hypothetical protein